MKTFVGYILILSLAWMVGCTSQPRPTASPSEIEAFNALVATKSFEINAAWARPMSSRGLNSVANAGLIPPGSTVNRIDIAGTASYLRVMGDSVMAYLPYFGEQQLGGIYNPNKAGIQFEGVPKDFTIEPNPKREGKTMRFTVDEGVETFQVIAQLFPSGSSTITVGSTHRTTIWYDGNFSKYDKE